MATRIGYQEGGLAQVVMDRGEDDDDPLDVPNTAGMRSKANPDAGEHTAEGVLKRRRMNRDQAIASLRQARSDILARKSDPSAKWWALAQGMLAPTRTGSFGESLGVTAGLMGQERRESREAEIAQMEQIRDIQEQERKVEEDLLRAEERMLAEQRRRDEHEQTLQAGRGHPFDKFTWIVDPRDGKEKKVLVRAVIKRDEDGKEYAEDMRDQDGNLVIRPNNLDPALRYAISAAVTRGALDPKFLNDRVASAEKAKDTLGKTLYGLSILDELEAAGEQPTGGIQGKIQQFRNFVGDSAKDVTDRGTLMNLMAFQMLETLRHFGKEINQKELALTEQLSAGIKQSAGVNRSLLQKLVRDVEMEIRGTQILIDMPDSGATARHRARMERPMINYGLGESYVQRMEQQNINLQDFIPFETVEGPAEIQEGDPGTQSNPLPVDTDSPTYHQVPKGKWFDGPGGTRLQN